jgi:hypothetical protein
MALMGLLGMQFSPAGVSFQPVLPEGVDQVALEGLPYRQQRLNVTVRRGGEPAGTARVNGLAADAAFLPAGAQGEQTVAIFI